MYISKLIRTLHRKLFIINDTTQKIALGAGLGVFAGIMPGMGLLVALFLAFVFRANRASAVIASLASNTWLSILTFILSVKIGSVIMNLEWHSIYNQWIELLKNFQWQELLKTSLLKTVLPIAIGYLILSILAGIIVYISALIILNIKRRNKNE
ncbi:MAG: DUF2062 domain-containing protein [Candidatus Omnitrophica bacterium]|nr:DUF2062 domain-containing protein [Candidatus Omnitrophota bacterium]